MSKNIYVVIESSEDKKCDALINLLATRELCVSVSDDEFKIFEECAEAWKKEEESPLSQCEIPVRSSRWLKLYDLTSNILYDAIDKVFIELTGNEAPFINISEWYIKEN